MEYSELFAFIDKCCVEQNIDESHGRTHAEACMGWVENLLYTESDVSDDERKLALYSAALHDMCDKKYTDVSNATIQIHSWLLGQGWTTEFADVLIRIIRSISYSKLKLLVQDGKPVFPSFGKWDRVYHIVRHADLLDGYLVGRCFLYTKHVYPNIKDDACWEIVEDLFKVRMFRYVVDGWIFLPEALKYAHQLEIRARWNLLDREFVYP